MAMKVYKFGGASVANADGVRNLARIVAAETDRLLVIVSAMGKTTNALENALDCFMDGRTQEALGRIRAIEEYHACVADGLWGETASGREAVERLGGVWEELRRLVLSGDPADKTYDEWYDLTVSYGEVASTLLVSRWLAAAGVPNDWLDMRRLFVTTDRHRDANIDTERSAPAFVAAVNDSPCRVLVGQGFIGSASDGSTTTLGREGSDYSAAAAAYMLGADSVTIWKDVEGILNADPKLFPDAQYIPSLGYLDAIELAHSGAQIIHPKTIKPLQNKSIPLYVKCFADPALPGSEISGRITRRTELPIIILKRRQVLLTLRPDDFSFVLEDRLTDVFNLLGEQRVKINLVQSSAVSLSLCIDAARGMGLLVDKLRAAGFHVGWNDDMELLTIRGYTPQQDELFSSDERVYMLQRTRRSLRLVRKASR